MKELAILKKSDLITNAAKNIGFATYKLHKIFTKPPFDEYNYQTFDIFSRILKKSSNCIDIGSNKGDILKKIIKFSPHGIHFAFEPIPSLFHRLLNIYGNRSKIYNYALSNKTGFSNFHYFTDRSAVSGLKSRGLDKEYACSIIKVETKLLDDVIPCDISIDMIKIDVEGAEYLVLEGGKNIIWNNKPFIFFEFGHAGAQSYNTTPEMIFDFISKMGMKINLLSYFLMGREGLNKIEFCGQFYKAYNIFFIAYDPKKLLQ